MSAPPPPPPIDVPAGRSSSSSSQQNVLLPSPNFSRDIFLPNFICLQMEYSFPQMGEQLQQQQPASEPPPTSIGQKETEDESSCEPESVSLSSSDEEQRTQPSDSEPDENKKEPEQQPCGPCTEMNFCVVHRQIRLVHKDVLEPCMWLNRHIEQHYRPLDMPWTLCLRSIFQWNNETLNVWSHLLGFILLTYLQFWSLLEALPRIRAPFTDFLVMGSAMLCCQVCMLLSSAYHIFGCHSPLRRKRWLRADLFGVSSGLIGLYLSGLYTSFYHFPEVRRLYGSLIGAMALAISLYVPFRRFSIHAQSAEKSRRIGPLQLLYVGMAFIALAPTWHWIQLNGGLSNPHVQKWLPNLFSLFALLAIAFVFYASMFPERLYPGRFDLVGCSHQWWHLLILAAMAYWHWSGIQLLSHYHCADAAAASANLPHNQPLLSAAGIGEETTVANLTSASGLGWNRSGFVAAVCADSH